MPRGQRPGWVSAEVMHARARAQAIAAADQLMVAAREQVSKAAIACLRQRFDASAQVRRALDLVEEARALIAKIEGGAEA